MQGYMYCAVAPEIHCSLTIVFSSQSKRRVGLELGLCAEVAKR